MKHNLFSDLNAFRPLKSVLVASFFSDAKRWHRRRRPGEGGGSGSFRPWGQMDENEMPVYDEGQEIPGDAREWIIAAFDDLETFDDEPEELEEYDIHPKHAI